MTIFGWKMENACCVGVFQFESLSKCQKTFEQNAQQKQHGLATENTY